MPDNMRPHRPTLFTVLIIVGLILVVKHFTLDKKR